MIELYFIDQCPARLCRALARVPGTIAFMGSQVPDFEGLVSARSWAEQRGVGHCSE